MATSVAFVAAVLLLCCCCLHSQALPICLNQESPTALRTSLSFCSSFQQNDSSCCNATTDVELQRKLQSFNVSDQKCANYLKQIICAQCDPYAGDLFEVQNQDRSVPVLCNSTSNTTNGYCQNVWSACESVAIRNSPFVTSLQGTVGNSASSTNATKLTDIWQTESNFCTSLGGSAGPGDFCYSGQKFVPLNSTTPLPNLEGICLEKLSNVSTLDMVPHPDGSNRVILATQSGQILLATLPLNGSGEPMTVNSQPFLDITDRVESSGEYGLLGVAFHPNFTTNGRFFISYNCDKSIWPDCIGRCACNSDTNCTISQLGPDTESVPCQVSSVISEYYANTSSEAVVANPNEVRRIFTMGLPYKNHHGGQILFGPVDHYLYFMMGDGGSTGDPFNFAQNKKSLLGKILRLDIDNFSDVNDWGNYSIPSDNPFVGEDSIQKEIWAYGFGNPWRCSFDSTNPSYFYCADVGQATYEEVDLVTKGGNYGWRVYEGTATYNPPRSPGGNTSAISIQPIFPILEYSHKEVQPKVGSASITGGFVSRSTQDACLYGRYVYADLYGGAMWAAPEVPPGSGNYNNTRVNFACSANSPLECEQSSSNARPTFLYLFSFGQDFVNDLYILSANGIFRVTNPSGCGFTCNAQLPSDAYISFNRTYSSSLSPSSSQPPSPNAASQIEVFLFWMFFSLLATILCIVEM